MKNSPVMEKEGEKVLSLSAFALLPWAYKPAWCGLMARIRNRLFATKWVNRFITYTRYGNQKDTYIEITENEFKTRYNQHTSSFRLPQKKSTTTLSEHVWNLENNNIEHCISWEIIENSHPYNTASKKCNLCTAEKYFILTGKPTLNKRREIFAQCPHRKKNLLQNIRESGTARQSTAPLRIVGASFPLETQCGATMITR